MKHRTDGRERYQARAATASRLAAVIRAWLEQASPAGTRADARTAASTAALVVGIVEAGARLLLDSDQDCSPAALADLAPTLIAGGIPALADPGQEPTARF